MPASYRLIYWCLYFCIKAGFLFSGYNLFSEEAQYWLWSKHPDWAYYSKPPLIAWVNFVTTSLFGDHELVIRLTALTLGAATLFMLYKVSMLLFKNKQLAHLSTMLLSIMPYFVLASTFFTTDSLLLFFWVCTFYFFLKALQENTIGLWAATGISFGLGCLSKQAMLFFILPLAWPLFWQNGKRYVRGQTLVVMLVLLFHLPILIWNYQHDWIMLHHLLNLAGSEQATQPSKAFRHLPELFGGFILINSPFFFPLFLRTFFHGRQSIPEADKQKLALIIVPAIGCLLLFTFVAFSKRVEVNWYNTGCMLLPIGLAYLIVQEKRIPKIRLPFYLTSGVLLLFMFPSVQDLTSMNRFIPVRFDVLKRLVGWQQLGEQVQALSHTYDSLAPFELVATDYQVASELAFYSGNKNVRCLSVKRKYDQFMVWSASGWNPAPVNTLLITDNPQLPPEVGQRYDKLDEKVVPIKYRGEKLYNYTIYVLRARQVK
ncbi:ArnT family glycosyltransferase [Pontibacter sp. MBLB2868]|uniref:ArnT family glycosyltransferase n=1 Tax=Pontibacter sp. MBLB2868 TaxID=3451555 RepID=UPI003F74FCEE